MQKKNILKRVLERDVRLSIGCTEPVAIAQACYTAAQAIRKIIGKKGKIEKIIVSTDPGVMKNGMSVAISSSKKHKGNAMAAAVGTLCDPSEKNFDLLNETRYTLKEAESLIDEGKISLHCNYKKSSLYIKASVIISGHEVTTIIEKFHTNITSITVDGKKIFKNSKIINDNFYGLDSELRLLTIGQMVDITNKIDQDDIDFLLNGADVNYQLALSGEKINRVGKHLKIIKSNKSRNRTCDNVSKLKIFVASAVDARMAGEMLPAMSSGGSGNQGIVATLVPYLIGQSQNLSKKTIAKSLALSHLLNSYVKTHTDNLSAMCGCAVGAGIGATAALTFQQKPDPKIISHAINNMVASVAGVLCDGAKNSCALKVIGSVEAAIISSDLALEGYSFNNEGIVGKSAEETIANLGKLSQASDPKINKGILEILCKNV